MSPPFARSWPILERGTGPPVVLLHGYPLDHRMWESQLGALSERHRVILLDLPGFGFSQEETGPDTLAGFASEVASQMVEHLRGPTVLVGHSFGGYVALQMYRDHPDLVSGLVLADTRSESDTAEARERRLETVRHAAASGQGLDIEAVTKSLLAPRSWSAGGPLVASVRTMVRGARLPSIARALTAIANRPDYTASLIDVGVPSLVLWGEEDQLIPPERTQAMLARLPRSVGVGIPGAGHLPAMEAPDLFNRAILGFLKPSARP